MATKIEWTEKTWNPVTGCTKVSDACLNCYAEVMARRLKAMGQQKYDNAFQVTLHHESLSQPFKWKKPSMVFVVSMGDLFHEDVPFRYIDQVMTVIRNTPQHTYQLLTKRAWRMEMYFSIVPVPKNAWLGVTCENSRQYARIHALRRIRGANIKFLSCEPLLDSLSNINLSGINWVIAGGESGPKARPSRPEWFRELRDRCIDSSTPFFFKQWGTWGEDGVKRSKKTNGCILDGREWKQLPDSRLTK